MAKTIDRRRQDYQEWLWANPLRAFRGKYQYTQAELAKLIGVSVYALKFWEYGSSFPRPETMQRIVEIVKDPMFKPDLETYWRTWRAEWGQ